jgi:LysR family glycine cleavage system transcriptional activator
MDRLPPMNAVRAFEAVGRHLSITLAAEELHVTPGAISRQVQTLEEFLGTPLLKRGHRQVTLTRHGADFHRAAARAVDLLRAAASRMRKAGRKQLKIRAYTTFAMRWLIPRLSGFQSAHPEIEVLLTASLEDVDFRREDLDAAIRLGDGQWPGVNRHRLVDNVLAPVCSPALLKGRAKLLRKPADLRHFTLLHSIARPDDWAYWLDANDASQQVDAASGMTYQSSAMAYAAAVEGQGLAMAQRFLVEDDLRAGKLVMPFKKTVDMGDYTYYLLTPAGRPESASMKQFRAWLLAQFAQA